MLSKNQWQWVADHHQKVRSISIVLISCVVLIYVGLIAKTIADKGKFPIPFAPNRSFSTKFDCTGRIKENLSIRRGEVGFSEDASILLFQRHRTDVADVELLKKYPDCLGASLVAFMDDPNPFVIVLYDSVNHRPIYRIARIDEVVKK